MAKIKGSDTIEITRSQIKLNPYNPKRHTDGDVAQQAKNIRKYGYLGGIVWNRKSGNLIDGHKRVMALDTINKYDGGNDYRLKVEVVDYDNKTELEQMTYMATKNTKADFNLIAPYFDMIDPDSIGLSDEEIRTIESLAADYKDGYMQDLSDSFMQGIYGPERKEETFDEIREGRSEKEQMGKKESVELKKRIKEVQKRKESDIRFHILLEFRNEDEHRIFCESLGYFPSKDMIINGMELLQRL